MRLRASGTELVNGIIKIFFTCILICYSSSMLLKFHHQKNEELLYGGRADHGLKCVFLLSRLISPFCH